MTTVVFKERSLCLKRPEAEGTNLCILLFCFAHSHPVQTYSLFQCSGCSQGPELYIPDWMGPGPFMALLGFCFCF